MSTPDLLRRIFSLSEYDQLVLRDHLWYQYGILMKRPPGFAKSMTDSVFGNLPKHAKKS